jgi:hypothetical protein
MLFHVENAPDDDEEMEDPESDRNSMGNGVKSHVKSDVLPHGGNGKQILREHVFRIRL